jgi:hypothetical protein
LQRCGYNYTYKVYPFKFEKFLRGSEILYGNESTHPNIAALVDPLFAFGGKRVEETNNFVMLNSVKDLFYTMHSSRIDPSLSLRMTKKKLPLSAEGEERDGERSKARVSLNRNITITHYIKFAYTQSVKHSDYQTHKLFPFLCAFIIKNLNALF